MVVLDIKIQEANKKQLEEFIDYLYSKCNKFLMALPNFDRTRYQQNEMNDSYKKYLKKVKPICDDIEPYVIYRYTTKNYITARSKYIVDAILVKFYEGFKSILLESGGFHKWLYPDYPEDLCFFEDEKCWFFTTAYESKFYIVEPTDEDIKMIGNIGIKYKSTFYRNFKSLEYYLDRKF